MYLFVCICIYFLFLYNIYVDRINSLTFPHPYHPQARWRVRSFATYICVYMCIYIYTHIYKAKRSCVSTTALPSQPAQPTQVAWPTEPAHIYIYMLLYNAQPSCVSFTSHVYIYIYILFIWYRCSCCLLPVTCLSDTFTFAPFWEVRARKGLIVLPLL